ncbi:tyrosine-type recombinase/integrase [Actinopolymorpha singaporensis]
MPTKAAPKRRQRGFIRRRGNSYQVLVYAGTDPLTGKDSYLTESTKDVREAERIRTRLLAQVDQQRQGTTKATLGYVLNSWMQTHDVEETTRDNYRWYVERVIRPALGEVPVKKVTARVLEELYAQLRRCRDRCDGKPYVEHRSAEAHECQTVRHRWGPGRPSARARETHDCAVAGCVASECKQHVCKPMAAATIRQVHFILSSALALAVRWEWIPSNPAVTARKPKRPAPQPDPPSAEQVALIVDAAWAQDEAWGTLVWLLMMTGARRGELAALRWHDLHLDAGVLEIRRSYAQRAGKAIEKGTKTHQMRRIALDQATCELLAAHRARYEERVAALELDPTDEAYVFSYEADHSRPCNPDAISHRYVAMCAALGIDSHLHALRHYSATELITAGVDIRTVAGRLGHGGGGTTTLRVYTAWVAESDRRAASILARRIGAAPER